MLTVTYRTAKQAGGKPRKAILPPTGNPEAILTTLHGEAVKAVSVTLSTVPDVTVPDTPIPIPIPIPIKETQTVGNLIALFGPDGFAADANWQPEDESETDEFVKICQGNNFLNSDTDDRDTFTAPIIAGLIADGWHPCNAKARADADWLWRHGPPVIAGGLLMRRVCPS